MATHDVALTEEGRAVVDALVAAGRFRDAGEAVDEGLRLLQKDEAERQAFLDRINAACDQAKAGDRAPGTADEVMERVMARARARWESRQGAGDAA